MLTILVRITCARGLALGVLSTAADSCYRGGMTRVAVTVVGAGVVGLAAALSVSSLSRPVVVVEQENGPGRQTSSRNSEVIHAGIYYPGNTLKAKLCVEGSRMLYAFCERHGIPHARIGKVVVASSPYEEESIVALWRRGIENGAEGLEMLTRTELAAREPHVQGVSALLSPNTGIVDSHRLIRHLEAMAVDKGCVTLYRTRLEAVDPGPHGYIVHVKGPDQKTYSFHSTGIVNSAGLHADAVASMAGIDIDEANYRIHRVKGQYFRVRRSKQDLVRGLVYPAPEKNLTGLGIHATKDLAGSLRLGPDSRYTKDLDYDVNPSDAAVFLERSRHLLPFLAEGDLSPDMAGLRPKLQGEGEPFRDFVIHHEEDRGLPAMISLVGIESPGLTSCLSIGEFVKRILAEAGLP